MAPTISLAIWCVEIISETFDVIRERLWKTIVNIISLHQIDIHVLDSVWEQMKNRPVSI